MPMVQGGISLMPVTISHTADPFSATNATAYTFSGAALGTAAANRKISVGVVGAVLGAPAVSTLTIGGVSASVVIAAEGTDATGEIWAADVPTGTTGDIVVTFASGSGRCCLSVDAIYGAGTSAHATASSGAATLSASLEIPNGGVATAIAFTGGTSPARTHTWANLTEDFDDVIETDNAYTGAHDAFLVGSTPTITCTPSGAEPRRVMVLASWGPA